MEINIKNIGIIKDASLKLNGLTVITGYNNSGKTTVGKVVYSLFSSIENLASHILDDQKNYAAKNIEHLWRNVYIQYINDKDNLDVIRKNMAIVEEKIQNCEDVRTLNEVLINFSEELEMIFASIDPELKNQKYLKDILAEFKSEIHDITEIINTRFSSLIYIREKLEMTLKEEFVEQISPLYDREAIGTISLEDNGSSILYFQIKNNSVIYNENNLGEYNTDKKVVFLDNVFLLDELSQQYKEDRRRFLLLDEDEPNISIKRHKEKLLDEINEASRKNQSVIENILNKEKLEKINTKISDTFDDDIIISKDGIYSSNSKVYIENLAMGSKVFAILKLLLTKGIINEKTVFVLDEPEVHLHPQWQSVLAEILALMIKELGIVVILTTHSPQFLLALEFYMKKYEQVDQFNVYMTEESKSLCVTYREVTENIQEAYYRLSKPMFDIKANMDKLDK